MKSVDSKQLSQVALLLRLLLQQKHLVCDNIASMAALLYEEGTEVKASEEISIGLLREKFEALGI